MVDPMIRVSDFEGALRFYQDTLGFEIRHRSEQGPHCSLSRAGTNVMLEGPSEFYSPAYNEAIRERLGTPSALALYIEAEDLDALYERLRQAGATIVDPVADRPWGQREFTLADPEGTWLTFWKAL